MRNGNADKTRHGGRTWRGTTTTPNTRRISAADPLYVWAASEDPISQSIALYTTEDAGATWHPLNLTSLGSP